MATQPPQKTFQYTVAKRDGTVQPFDLDKLDASIRGAFKDTHQRPKAGEVAKVSEAVCRVIMDASIDARVTSAKIGDAGQVELSQAEPFPQAKSFILYRDSRRRARDASKRPSIF